MMLGNEPALEKYLKEKPRRRDESIVSPQMMIQIGVMGVWLVVISFLYLKLPFFKQLFAVDGQYNAVSYTHLMKNIIQLPVNIILTYYVLYFVRVIKEKIE